MTNNRLRNMLLHRKLLDLLFSWSLSVDDNNHAAKISDVYVLAGMLDNPKPNEIKDFVQTKVLPLVRK